MRIPPSRGRTILYSTPFANFEIFKKSFLICGSPRSSYFCHLNTHVKISITNIRQRIHLSCVKSIHGVIAKVVTHCERKAHCGFITASSKRRGQEYQHLHIAVHVFFKDLYNSIGRKIVEEIANLSPTFNSGKRISLLSSYSLYTFK